MCSPYDDICTECGEYEDECVCPDPSCFDDETMKNKWIGGVLMTRIINFIRQLWEDMMNTCPNCGYYCTGKSVFCTPPIEENNGS